MEYIHWGFNKYWHIQMNHTFFDNNHFQMKFNLSEFQHFHAGANQKRQIAICSTRGCSHVKYIFLFLSLLCHYLPLRTICFHLAINVRSWVPYSTETFIIDVKIEPKLIRCYNTIIPKIIYFLKILFRKNKNKNIQIERLSFRLV